MRGFTMIDCCDVGDIFDFFAYPNTSAIGTGNTDANNLYYLTRISAIWETGDARDSTGKWEVDVPDVANSRLHYTRALNVQNDQTVIYAIETTGGTARMEVVSYQPNVAPTLDSTLSQDWNSSPVTGCVRLDDSPTELGLTASLTMRPVRTVPNYYYFDSTINQAQAGPKLYDIDLTTMTASDHWNAQYVVGDYTGANWEKSRDWSNDALTYWSANFRPASSVRNEGKNGIGIKLEATIGQTTWTYSLSTGWEITGEPTFSYTATYVFGDINYSAENSTVTNDTTLYTFNSPTFDRLEVGSGVYGPQHDRSIFIGESVRLFSLESIEDNLVGIAHYYDTLEFEIGADYQDVLDNNPTPSDMDTWDTDSFIYFFTASGAPYQSLAPSVPSGSYSRIDLILNGTPASTGLTSSTATGDHPVRIRHAIGDDGDPNGKYFLITETDGDGATNGWKLKYISNATTDVWEIDFDSITDDMEVSDRFVYVRGTLAGESGPNDYAVDYDGELYQVYYNVDTNVSMSNSLQNLGSGAYFERFACVKYSDDLSPDETIMNRHGSLVV